MHDEECQKAVMKGLAKAITGKRGSRKNKAFSPSKSPGRPSKKANTSKKGSRKNKASSLSSSSKSPGCPSKKGNWSDPLTQTAISKGVKAIADMERGKKDQGKWDIINKIFPGLDQGQENQQLSNELEELKLSLETEVSMAKKDQSKQEKVSKVAESEQKLRKSYLKFLDEHQGKGPFDSSDEDCGEDGKGEHQEGEPSTAQDRDSTKDDN